MATHIELRRDVAANWTSANPVLALAEEGVETDTGRRKFGDGVTTWTALPYAVLAPADLLTRWRANTAYNSGDIVLNPSGQIVQALASFTSGSSYSSSNWTVLTGVTTSLAVASTATSAGTLGAGKHTPVDVTSGSLTMTLPTGQASGTLLSVEKADATANTVTLSGSIRGSAGQTVSLVWQRETLLMVADASGSWWPVAGHKTKTSLDANYEVVINHGSAASVARPSTATSALWIGTVQPTNLQSSTDVWINPSAGPSLSDLGPPTSAISMGSQLVQNAADPVSAQDLATRGWTLSQINATATPHPVGLSKSATVTPSATANTYGTAQVISPDTGHSEIVPVAIGFPSSGLATETVTIQITATYSDASTNFVTASASTNATNNLSATSLASLMGNGKYVTQLSFQAKSTIASSTASLAVIVGGTQW